MSTRPSRKRTSDLPSGCASGRFTAREAGVRSLRRRRFGRLGYQAKLRFFVTNGTPDGPAVYQTGAWPRKPLTWARRPAVIGGPRGDKGQLVPGTWVEWDVTPWVTRNDAYRFALRGGAADALELTSRETNKGMSPQLVVTTDSAPPPDPPSTVVYVAPTQGATVSGVRDGARAGACRDRLGRRVRLRRRVGRRGSSHGRERGVVGAVGYADRGLLERHAGPRRVGVPRRRLGRGQRDHHR